MMTANLWAEADLVNGGCHRIDNLRIVKPVDERRSRTRSVALTSLRGLNHLNVGWQHKGCPAYSGLGHHNPQGTRNDYSMDRDGHVQRSDTRDLRLVSPSSSHFPNLKLFMDCDRLLPFDLRPLQAHREGQVS
jgi:hypothetical protein